MFDIDVLQLQDGYGIHFDLDNESIMVSTVCTGHGRNRVCTSVPNGDIDRNPFAPFSHDAQSGDYPPPPPERVPEPTSLAFAGLGLVMAGLAMRTLRRSR